MYSVLVFTLVSSLLLAVGILFAVVYRAGAYRRVILVSMLAKLSTILLNSRLNLISKADLSDYLPHFLQFHDALVTGSLVDFIGIHVSAYTLFYPGWLFALPVSTGDAILMIRLANTVVSVFLLYPLNELSKDVFGTDLDRWQALLLLTWPSYVPFTITIGRTQLSVFLVLLSLVLINRFMRERSISSIGLAISAVSLSTILRIHYIVFPASYALLAIVINTRSRLDNREFIYFNMISSTILGTVSLATYSYLVKLYTGQTPSSIDFIINSARVTATGGSAYLTSLYPSGYIDLVWYLPLQGFYFLFSPMPWQALHPSASAILVVTAVETWMFLGLIIISFGRNMGYIRTNKRLLTLLAMVFLVSVGLGAGVKNAGGAHRWRMPLQLLLILISTTLLTRSDG
ncbi:hypothetical protein [Halobacterium sp. KA-6]|uniref:hypothetical protein n=1 Tax=Halobacterium sp. KA-6 TaxID=2896368 RepID=UPI001E63CCB7|nr:hypothetical protein [Halobacterium sp. KA-6]MCD2204876.1 hypothetical protein [Halobacterium sp. KA-6]